MKLMYAPQGAEPQTFEFDTDELLATEAEDVETVGGVQWDTFGQWLQQLNTGGFRAWRAALWIMLRRSNPTLVFSDLNPRVGEIDLDFRDEPAEAAGEGKGEVGDSPTDST